MFKYVAILFLLKSIVSGDLDYKYDEYIEEGFSSSEEEVYNITQREKPNRVDDMLMSNIIEGTESSSENYTLRETTQVEEIATEISRPVPSSSTSSTTPAAPVTRPRLHHKRECNFTGARRDGAPAPDPKDSITTYPFAASVLRMGSHYASGALVDRRWVLTAGGVFYNVRESIKLFRVRLGSVDCKQGGSVLALQQVVVHPAYAPGKPECDLAMLRLSRPVELSAMVHPVSLTERKGKVEIGKFLTMYWPRVIVDGRPLPPTAKERKQHTNLRVSTQKVIPWNQCLRSLSYRQAGLSHDNFCLRPLRQHHTICLPDVGAPVVSTDGLWGLVSGWVGQPCSFADPSPVLVVRVSPPAVRYWIEAQMEQDD